MYYVHTYTHPPAMQKSTRPIGEESFVSLPNHVSSAASSSSVHPVSLVAIASSPGLPRLLIAASDLRPTQTFNRGFGFKSEAAIKSLGRPGDEAR